MRDRQAADRRGRRAERLAALWLSLKGYRVLARRARTGAGEIDLVARRGRTLAFIEVKARASRGEALEAFRPRQQDRLLAAASLWRAQPPALAGLQPRFDAILIAPGRPPQHLQGIVTAQGEARRRLI